MLAELFRAVLAADAANLSVAARLADLPHAQLLEIAAAGCEASTQVMKRADALLAAHKPLAMWAVEGVLLSSDLVPHLLAPLQLEDGAAAAVCSRWLEVWKDTSEGRRRLTRAAFKFRHKDLLSAEWLRMAVTPGGDELVVKYDEWVCFLGRDMSNRGDIYQLPTAGPGYIAASEEFIYANVDDFTIHCFTHAGTEVANYEDPDKYIDCHTLAPGGLLFCVLFDTDDNTQDEIVALDAQTLQPRHRFGLSLLKYTCGMAVVGEELFVGDTGNDRLQVFSLAGEHRRSITGEWKRPLTLCFVKDRLYLVEEQDHVEADDGELVHPLATWPAHLRRAVPAGPDRGSTRLSAALSPSR